MRCWSIGTRSATHGCIFCSKLRESENPISFSLPAHPKFRKQSGYWLIVIFSYTENTGQNKLNITKHEIKKEIPGKILRLACSIHSEYCRFCAAWDPAGALTCRKGAGPHCSSQCPSSYSPNQFAGKYNEKLCTSIWCYNRQNVCSSLSLNWPASLTGGGLGGGIHIYSKHHSQRVTRTKERCYSLRSHLPFRKSYFPPFLFLCGEWLHPNFKIWLVVLPSLNVTVTRKRGLNLSNGSSPVLRPL